MFQVLAFLVILTESRPYVSLTNLVLFSNVRIGKMPGQVGKIRSESVVDVDSILGYCFC